MDSSAVVIVGAGPSGLALGLALSRFQISSVILEKTEGITSDPRGVYLTGDAVRILHDLGIQDTQKIGHQVHSVQFHKSSFATKPYYDLSIGTSNALKQVVAEGLLQSQPKLEFELRKKVHSSQWCELREGCCVVGRSEEDPPVVDYIDKDGQTRHIKCQWLVGADGKTGIVRKRILEPTAGIVQQEGTYRYSGTWIAANLKITLPTPETHPEFPLWSYSYSSDEVYDLFWPKGWHFCSPPGKPTASGRFGPYSDRTWRHELCQDDWNDSMDAEALMFNHLAPMITRDVGKHGEQFASPIQFPRDCIEVLRCRPFKFVHKVVNRWFDKRSILIGDAAHVFPPFAGQGIASGVRDAHQLAWRLALLIRTGIPTQEAQPILQAWSVERRKSVDDAAMFSIMNGHLCNNEPSSWLQWTLWLHKCVEAIPTLPTLLDPQGFREAQGFTGVQGGFLSNEFRGGSRLAQIYVQPASGLGVMQSDELLRQSKSIFTLLITTTREQDHTSLVATAREAIMAASVEPSILSPESIIMMSSDKYVTASSRPSSNLDVPTFWPASGSDTSEVLPHGYDAQAYISRVGRSTKFSILRPDFYCFACVKNKDDLVNVLTQLKERCAGR